MANLSAYTIFWIIFLFIITVFIVFFGSDYIKNLTLVGFYMAIFEASINGGDLAKKNKKLCKYLDEAEKEVKNKNEDIKILETKVLQIEDELTKEIMTNNRIGIGCKDIEKLTGGKCIEYQSSDEALFHSQINKNGVFSLILAIEAKYIPCSSNLFCEIYNKYVILEGLKIEVKPFLIFRHRYRPNTYHKIFGKFNDGLIKSINESVIKEFQKSEIGDECDDINEDIYYNIVGGLCFVLKVLDEYDIKAVNKRCFELFKKLMDAFVDTNNLLSKTSSAKGFYKMDKVKSSGVFEIDRFRDNIREGESLTIGVIEAEVLLYDLWVQEAQKAVNEIFSGK